MNFEESNRFTAFVWDKEIPKLEEYSKFHREHPHCSTPRTRTMNMEGLISAGTLVVDESNPNIVYGKVIRRGVKVPIDYRTKTLGVDADFNEVDSVATEHETSLRYEKNSQHADPWWNQSVAERKSTYHTKEVWADTLNTIDTRPEKPIPKEYQTKDLVPREAKEILDTVSVLEEWGKGTKFKVGPWDQRIEHSKYTETGTEMQEYNAMELNRVLDLALEEYRSSTAGHKIASKSGFSEATKKNMLAFQTMKKELGGDEGVEKLGNSFIKYAEKTRKTKNQSIFDFGVDFPDACLRGNAYQVLPMLAFGSDPNCKTDTEEPVLWAVFNKVSMYMNLSK